ncbi:hypothetical protein [Aquisphaera insulae]|uniref:hypothetical protein n=1 Tax=Aquisphaera insulae TaxID=2712864 RepID=UPI0013EA3E30|nr:hypothetical protein [Aquisphaera insulae]
MRRNRGRGRDRRPRLEPLERRALLSAGSLDPTFGSGGSVTTDFPLVPATAQGTGGVVDSSGRLVVAGLVSDADGDFTTVLMRYTRGGALDPTFGQGGRIVTPIVGRQVLIGVRPSVALDASGDILVTGPLSRPPYSPDWAVNDFAVARYTPGGRLDTTFGDHGIAATNIGYALGSTVLPTDDTPSAIAVQPDGKIVVSGTTSGNPYDFGIDYAFGVARFNADGSLDAGFGTGGHAVAAPSGPYSYSFNYSYAYDLALAPDGKIVVAGTTTSDEGSSWYYTAARFTTAGQLDTGFASDGIYFGRSAGFFAFPGDAPVVVQADGKVVLGETISWNFSLQRLNVDGTPDASFGTASVVTTVLPTTSRLTDLALQPDGKILAVGWNSSGTTSTNTGFVLARYSGTTGAADASFGTGGVSITSPPVAQDRAKVAALQPDGKILLVGYTPVPSPLSPVATAIEVARFDARGGLDTHYASGGRNTATFTGSRKDTASDVATLPGGLVLVAGTTSTGASPYGGGSFGLTEYLPNGWLNPFFGQGGRVITSFGGDNDTASAMAVQRDGKIVVVGTTESLDTSTYTTTRKFAIARYNIDGSLDRSFGTGGLLTIDLGDSDDTASGVAIQADGKIVVSGTASSYGSSVAAVRVTSRGALDPTFGAGGIALASSSPYDVASSVVIQPDGKIVLGGSTVDANYQAEGMLVRFKADGTLDPAFGTAGVATLPGMNGITSLAFQPGSGIIAAGTATQIGDTYYATVFEVARFTTAGVLDPAFGTAGVTQVLVMPATDLGGPDYAYANAVVVQPDGKIVVGGSAFNLGYAPNYTSSPSTVALARLNSQGALAPSFGTAGVVVTSLVNAPPQNFSDVSLALAPGGKIVASYSALPNPYTGSDFGVVRFLGDRPSLFPWGGLLRSAMTVLSQALPPSTTPATPIVAPQTSSRGGLGTSSPITASATCPRVDQSLRRAASRLSLLDEALGSLLDTP